jgi:hypothetical protein
MECFKAVLKDNFQVPLCHRISAYKHIADQHTLTASEVPLENIIKYERESCYCTQRVMQPAEGVEQSPQIAGFGIRWSQW